MLSTHRRFHYEGVALSQSNFQITGRIIYLHAKCCNIINENLALAPPNRPLRLFRRSLQTESDYLQAKYKSVRSEVGYLCLLTITLETSRAAVSCSYGLGTCHRLPCEKTTRLRLAVLMDESGEAVEKPWGNPCTIEVNSKTSVDFSGASISAGVCV